MLNDAGGDPQTMQQVAPEIDPLGLQFSEDTWVDFKLFGLMGMTIAFVVAQAVYLARYMPDTDEETN